MADLISLLRLSPLPRAREDGRAPLRRPGRLPQGGDASRTRQGWEADAAQAVRQRAGRASRVTGVLAGIAQ